MTQRKANDRKTLDPDMWKAMVQKHDGSWWIPWAEWLKLNSGEMKEPLEIKGALMAAPGSYVFML